MNHFKGKQFQKDVIIVAVGYYLRYNLSYRDVQEILYNRGINVSHTTVYRWVQEYGKGVPSANGEFVSIRRFPLISPVILYNKECFQNNSKNQLDNSGN